MDVHQSRQRAQRIMRGHHHVLRLRDGGDFLLLQQSASQADIRLDDIGCAFGQQLLKLKLRVQFLARGDGNLHPPPKVCHGVHVFVPQRLFQKQRTNRF